MAAVRVRREDVDGRHSVVVLHRLPAHGVRGGAQYVGGSATYRLVS